MGNSRGLRLAHAVPVLDGLLIVEFIAGEFYADISLQTYPISFLKKIEDALYRGPGLGFGIFLHSMIHDQINPASTRGRRYAEVNNETAGGQDHNQRFGFHGISRINAIG